MSKTASIIGFGSYLPEKVLSNADLEKMVDTNDEWIFSRTGMKERRIASDDQATSDLGYESAKKAIADAEIAPEDIELIIFATLSPDYAFPSTSCIVQERLGCSKAAAMDVQAACTGYIYALAMAKGFIESGTYKNILVVAAEKLSSIVNYKDRGTCVLFGDGASAAVISSEKKGYRLNGFSLGADGKQSELLILPAGGSRNPTSFDTVSNDQHYLQMEGKEVFKHAVRRMEAAARECLEKDGIPEDQISWLVPHQANIRIIEAIAKRFKIPMEKVFLTVHKYGNTSASSVGIALEELIREKEVAKGENLLLVAFGAGLTWGAATLTKEV